ncbi:hypothetical protein WIW89_09350 [Stygiolobus sp. CP850M]|uniref:hypothetical protein n=1 Tax=Stygiolobus sp. CP850M TaxID=3133134 RepID=UPI00307EFB83
MVRKFRKGLSDIIGFLILLIFILGVMVPLLFYVTFSYSQGLVPESPPQPNIGVINITYTVPLYGTSKLLIQWTAGSPKPVVFCIYNYSIKGEWVKANYVAGTPSSSNTECFVINGPANTLLVQLEYLNETYYAQVGTNSSVLVG